MGRYSHSRFFFLRLNSGRGRCRTGRWFASREHAGDNGEAGAVQPLTFFFFCGLIRSVEGVAQGGGSHLESMPETTAKQVL